MTPLLILLVAGLGSVHIANLAWTDQPTLGGLARGSLRRDGVVSDRAPLALPGAAVIRPAALGLTLVVLATAARAELLAVAGFVVIVSLFYFGWRRASANR